MFTENLDAFLGTDDFAKAGSYTPNNGSGAVTVNVIFDEAEADKFNVSASNPVAVGKATDFSASSAIGAAIVIDLTTFTIRDLELIDDGALVRLQLSRP